jgi:hypothetical protein
MQYITKENLVRKIATAYNTLNSEILTDLIADDFVYESQHVFEPMNGKDNFLKYIAGKYKTIQNSKSIVYAEIGYHENTPCIIISQGEKDNKGALLFLELTKEGDKIQRMDMCGIAPHWSSAKRTHEYPGLTAEM